eukprot:UN00711
MAAMATDITDTDLLVGRAMPIRMIALPGISHHIPSMTQSHSSGDHGHHTVIHPHVRSSSEDEDVRCDTMYGDEDEHHQPLALYTNLGDLYEDPLENLEENDGPKTPVIRSKMAKPLGNLARDSEKKQVKHSTTWSKIFKHKKLSDDEESDNGKKKERKKLRLNR